MADIHAASGSSKRMRENLPPASKFHEFQTIASSQPQIRWDDLAWRLTGANGGGDDVFQLFFIRTTPEMVKEKRQLAPQISVAFDQEDRILYLEIPLASLACHTTPDYGGELEGRPPVFITSSYDPGTDILDVSLVTLEEHRARIYSTDELDQFPSIWIAADEEERVLSIDIERASTTLRKATHLT